MIDTKKLFAALPNRSTYTLDLQPNPTKEDLREVVKELQSEGLCGRRIAEDHLGPYFIAHDSFGQPEIELLDEVIDEEYAGTDFCTRTRQSECSRLRGGCKGSR